MKKYAILIPILVYTIEQSTAQEIPPQTHPDVSEWEDLFNADLGNAIYPGGIWSNNEGILTATEDQNIWTNREYDNFIIDLEFKTDEGTNSGVIVYCSDTENWIPNSVEIQIADDYAEKWANSSKTWQCGAVFGHLAASESRVKKPGEWNRYTITCQDKMIYVMLNGVVGGWYREQIKRAVPLLIEKWEPLLGVKVEQFFVQRMKTKWGGCNSAKGHIRLNTDLAKKPQECLEYIVVHEMVHLLEPTHNVRFVALMDNHIPQWQHYRDMLNRLPVAHEKWSY